MGRYLDEEDGYDFEMGRIQAQTRMMFIGLLVVTVPMFVLLGAAVAMMVVGRLLGH